jgi:predicted ribosome-associated RNA-binding protein Tma20
MAKKIDFKKPISDEKSKIKEEKKIIEDFGVINEIMDKKYPDKLLFDMKTVSEELSCSYEFVRVRTDNGKIKFIKLGANKMIPRSELIKLLTKGV